MRTGEFFIGLEFYTAAGKWRCTDIGTRVIVAIRVACERLKENDDRGRHR